MYITHTLTHPSYLNTHSQHTSSQLHSNLRKPSPFSVYYSIGNSRFPEHPSIGALGIYQCQFPFDLDTPFKAGQAAALSTFDVVMVNSAFTQKHYTTFARRAFANLDSQNRPYPSLQVVFPPVYAGPVGVPPALPPLPPLRTSGKGEVVRMVMVGRIFQGRQSKGHAAAIAAITALNNGSGLSAGSSGGGAGAANVIGTGIGTSTTDPRIYELHICGAVQPGHETYAASLRAAAAQQRVIFHTDAPRPLMAHVVANAHIVWHLTGLDADPNDPAR
jgi:hypothetical protein